MRGLNLYHRKSAAVERISVGQNQIVLSEITPGRLVVSIISDLCNTFGVCPVVYQNPPIPIVSVLFRSICICCEDLSIRYGELAGALSLTWPLLFSGTVESQENVCMSFSLNASELMCIKESFSGKDFDWVEGLCLEWSCTDSESANMLATILSSIHPHLECVCENRRLSRFLEKNDLLLPTPGTLFCYVPLNEETRELKNYIDFLTLDQKSALWETFLVDNYCPFEFEWLEKQLALGNLHDYLEWEFSLDMTMERHGFGVSNMPEAFCIVDGDGHQRRFDYNKGSIAERVFLKFLFPSALGS